MNLAASLAVAEQSVLLVDLDPQSNASTGVGCNPTNLQQGSYELLIGTLPIHEAVTQTPMPYLSLIAANRDLVGAERDLLELEDSAMRLREALIPIRGNHNFIIIDCPPSLGMLTINALTAADLVIVPLQCEYYALEGLSQLTQTIERVRAAFNPKLQIHGVVLTMFDSRNNLANEVADEVRRHFKVYNTVIPRNVRLAEAPSHGKPAILYDASSRGSYSYLNLARELLEDLEVAA